MGDGEGEVAGAGVTFAYNIQAVWCKILLHLKVKLCRRRVIQHIPGTEQQLMMSFTQLWYAESQLTTAIVTEVIVEIAVQIVCLQHISIHYQLKVVTDAAA